MSTVEARRRAHNKYQAEKVDVIYVRVPRGKKEILLNYANKKGVSVNSLINNLINKELDESKAQ